MQCATRCVSRRRARAVAMALVLVVVAGAAVPGQARGAVYMRGHAHVSDTFNGDATKQGATQSGTGGGAITDTASIPGSSASYNLHPAGGVGAIAGQSQAISITQWRAGRETQADAFMQISDGFTVVGDLEEGPSVHGATIRVNWSGSLIPNAEFEAQHLATEGRPTVTARATLDMSISWFNSAGALVGSASRNQSRTGVPGQHEFESTMNFPVGVGNDYRTFRFTLTIGGVGSRGGGFNFLGSGELDPAEMAAPGGELATATAAAAAGESLLDDSFFEIVVELPPGLSIDADEGHYIRQVTIPEPASLAFLAPAALAFRRRRRPRSSTSSGGT